jgi:UDP-GlcNAc:undecaprenyl-phosphate/decaprenyl-phosphate GlcNAc-1-phosphate transferase
MPLWLYPLVLAVSLAGAALLTPLAVRLGKQWGIVDRPGGRRSHQGEIPRIGGLGIYPAFVLAAVLPVILGVPRDDPLELTRLVGVLLGMGVVWIVGLLDDRYKLPPWVQLGGLAIAAMVAIAFKVFVEVFNNPLTDQQIWVDWYLMVPITLGWLIVMSDTVNMVDGLDGLAAGVTAIAAGVLFIHMQSLGQYSVSLLPLALIGCCLGFLVFNFYPARIFLGGGAYVLGYALGALAIVGGAKFASVLMVLWLPIVDIVWQIYSRWRRGQPIALGDRGHLHLRLQDLGWPMGRIVLLYYGITALLGAMALLSPLRILKLGILVGGGVIILVLLAIVARAGADDIATGT